MRVRVGNCTSAVDFHACGCEPTRSLADLVEVVEVAGALGVEPCELVQDVARSLQLGRHST
jgi:hypothetical protein